MLLGLEGIHLHGHLGWRDQILQEDETPAAPLRPITEIQILGQRVVLPSARVVDGSAPPDSRGTVEIEEEARAITAPVLEDEVAVEQNRLDLREERVVLVDMTPARLHHRDFRV